MEKKTTNFPGHNRVFYYSKDHKNTPLRVTNYTDVAGTCLKISFYCVQVV